MQHTDYKPVPLIGGPLSIWEYPDPKLDYVAGIDTGEGLAEEYSWCDIFCRQTGAQVANYATNRQDPEEFALTCLALCRYYNTALTVIERNSVGYTVVAFFKMRYRRSRIWRDKSKIRIEAKKKKEFGWDAKRGNRPPLIFEFKGAVKKGYMKIRDKRTLDQMKSFIRKEEGRMEHAEGECDDAVFAAALAWQGFKDIVPKLLEVEPREKGPTTIGEFVRVARLNDKPLKSKTYHIGKKDETIPMSIVIRR